MIRAWFITGAPGVGKTTALLKLVDLLKRKGYTLGGIVSREVRRGGVRIGFEMVDLMTEERGTLASKELTKGPRVGSYRVDLESLSKFSKALLRAMRSCDVVVCDEIGPMELMSPDFKRAVRELMDSGKPVIGVIHRKVKDDLVVDIKGRGDVRVVELTYENRNRIVEELGEELLRWLGGDRGG